MRVINLGSGSKGNATLVDLDDGYLLIDCGLSRFETLLEEQGISLCDIKYVFITHNHTDHVLNIKKFNPEIIYCAEETIDIEHNVLEFYEEYDFGKFKITPLKTSHDAPDSVAYLIKKGESELVYITDTGKIPAKTKRFLNNRRFYIIESNYDEDMLMESERPLFLKERIKSDKGHLSNLQCSIYLNSFIGENTKGIAFAHISEECNSEYKIAAELKDFPLELKIFLKQREVTIIEYDEN